MKVDVNMRILVHGAINGSNFGECLFAKPRLDKLKSMVLDLMCPRH